jgi:hypothetical protein
VVQQLIGGGKENRADGGEDRAVNVLGKTPAVLESPVFIESSFALML